MYALRDKFNSLAVVENGIVKIEENNLVVRYYLQFEYDNIKVLVKNSYGNQSFGSVSFVIRNLSKDYSFEIHTRGHLIKLLLDPDRSFTVKSKSINFTNFLRTNSALKNLGEYVDTSQFEPTFVGDQVGTTLKVSMYYSNLFIKKLEVIEPFIEFSKSLIDKLQHQSSAQ